MTWTKVSLNDAGRSAAVLDRRPRTEDVRDTEDELAVLDRWAISEAADDADALGPSEMACSGWTTRFLGAMMAVQGALRMIRSAT